MKLGRALCCSLLFGAVAACGQAGPELLGQESQAIYNGYPSGVEDDGILKLANINASGVTNYCTGSLIAPNVVLTARHCVSNLIELPFTCTDDGELTADSKGGRFGALIDPADIKFYVGAAFSEPLAALGAKIFATQTPTICRNDLAVVVLDRELTGVPLMAIRIDRGNQRGEVLRAVGYGETEDAMRGVRRAKDGLIVSKVGASQFRTDGDAIPPRTFLTLGPALCIGDSGGPALTADGAVTGVYSQLVGACSSPYARQYFTQVAPFADEVLTPAFELTGYQPIVESGGTGEGGAGGDAGTIGEPEGGGDEAGGGGGASSTAGGENSNAGTTDGTSTPPPPEKGGCRCATPATPRSGSVDRLATALMLGVVGYAVSRRRRRSGERAA